MSWHVTVAIAYGLMLTATTALAWLSGARGLRTLSTLVALPYVVSVGTFFHLGPRSEPWFDLVSFFVMGVLMLFSAFHFSSRLAYFLFSTYIMSLCIVAASFFSDTAGDGVYFWCLNVTFVARMLAIGGISIGALARGNTGARRHRSRRLA